MKRLGMTMVLLGAVLVADAMPASAQSASDSAAVMATALDYIDGYYTSDGPRMARAVHPDVAKRIVREPDGPDSQLQHMTATQLVEITAGGGARRIPGEARREDVEILDIYNNVASVRIDAGGWIDYLHVARWNGEWKIINVLWEWAPSN
jgi:hypothetical protein